MNRCLTEGRRAFLARVEGIESGEECERWAPVLSAMADGEARARDVLAVRPHLRNCAGCRTSLGEMRRAPAAAAALLPVGWLGAPAGGGLLDRLSEVAFAVQERVVAPLVKVQSAVEATGATKLAAVAASTVALAGGGVAVQHSAAGEPPRPAASQSHEPAATATVAELPASAPPPQPERVSAAEPAPAESDPPARPPARDQPPTPTGDEFALDGDSSGASGRSEPSDPSSPLGAAEPAGLHAAPSADGDGAVAPSAGEDGAAAPSAGEGGAAAPSAGEDGAAAPSAGEPGAEFGIGG